ncbi:sigma-70 family RNA polymerase sigma factor [Actinoplanes sp. NPDC026619]|uniref:sigma-70 family RNA polymerase sigma factor n=1 Tax=Actinoplanes sp. NPDC026619 TaxID=3155798 RepID=UPI0033E608B7
MVTQSQIAPEVARLVRDAQDGSGGALDELIALHMPLVYNIIGRALAGHPDVDDLVQETMLRAVRGLSGLRDPDRFRSWLVSIAYRQIQLYLRSRKATRMRRVNEPIEVADPRGDFADRAAAEMVVADQRRELAEAARWLDDGDRRLLGLWWQEASGELTRTELAEALEVQPKHAAVRVQRMKAQLDAARGVVRALRARPRCPELTDQLRRWNGVADPLWRKRFVRHIRECPMCEPRRSGLVAPEELLLGMGALPVPVGLLAGLKATALPAKFSLLGLLQHKTLTVATATTVAVGGGLAYAVYHEALPPGDDTVTVSPTLTRSAEPGTARRVQTTPPAPAPTSAVAAVPVADIFVAPGGSDSGNGSVKKPYATLAKAVAAVKPGQTIAVRGGTYRPAAAISIEVSGTAAKRIVLTNYGNEKPVIDVSGIPANQWAITQSAAFWTVQGLEVTGARSHAYVCLACHDVVFRRLSMHDNAGAGLMLRNPGTANNQVLDSDFSNSSSGLSIQFGAGAGNLVRGNRAYGNRAAGFDLGGFTDPVAIEYNWSFRNQTGFALAGSDVAAAHKLRHNASWSNSGSGFTDDGATGAVQMSNNTAWHNGGSGFAFPNSPVLLRSNAAADNPVTVSANAQLSRNDWAFVFGSTDPKTAEGPRPPSGLLPQSVFLVTGNGVGASMGGY